ncbi:B12-binding domain-containing radical SAM protein [bacterium]|nr:B12-binding domain-containing radical SAM protein [bacterium]
MKVSLFFAPYNHKLFEENIYVVDEDFGVFPPIPILYVASAIENAGHEVQFIDANAEGISMEEAYQRMKKFDPDIIGCTLTTYMFQQTLGWIRYFKERLDVKVMVGGINLRLYPRETLSYDEIDYGIVGEGVENVPKLLKAIEEGRGFEDIEGLAYKKNGEIIINPPAKDLDLDTYPFPARHLIDNSIYESYISQRKNFTVILTAVGCPYKCVFCPMANSGHRVRTAESVLAEIDECYNKYDIHEIDFFDPSLLTGKKRLEKILDGLLERNYDLEWSCRARVDQIEPDIVEKMAKTNCRQVYIGIESMNQNVLNSVQKGITVDQADKAVNILNNHGVRALGFFMIGNPGETISDIKQTIRYSLSLKLYYVQYSRTIAKPDTSLHKEIIEATGRDYWQDYVLGKVGEERLPTPWNDLTEKEVEKYTKLAYYRFYFRPSKLLKIILGIKSFSEFWRYVKTGTAMITNFFRWDKEEEA